MPHKTPKLVTQLLWDIFWLPLLIQSLHTQNKLWLHNGLIQKNVLVGSCTTLNLEAQVLYAVGTGPRIMNYLSSHWYIKTFWPTSVRNAVSSICVYLTLETSVHCVCEEFRTDKSDGTAAPQGHFTTCHVSLLNRERDTQYDNNTTPTMYNTSNKVNNYWLLLTKKLVWIIPPFYNYLQRIITTCVWGTQVTTQHKSAANLWNKHKTMCTMGLMTYT